MASMLSLSDTLHPAMGGQLAPCVHDDGHSPNFCYQDASGVLQSANLPHPGLTADGVAPRGAGARSKEEKGQRKVQRSAQCFFSMPGVIFVSVHGAYRQNYQAPLSQLKLSSAVAAETTISYFPSSKVKNHQTRLKDVSLSLSLSNLSKP